MQPFKLVIRTQTFPAVHKSMNFLLSKVSSYRPLQCAHCINHLQARRYVALAATSDIALPKPRPIIGTHSAKST